MKILQLGKFFPVRGGVEKVMYDLTLGLSSRGIECDMLCASLDKPGQIQLNPHGRVICTKAWFKAAGTMISPSMILWLRKHRDEYDIIHIHHPDPMAALALRLSGYKGRVILHWHSDIVSQKELFTLYLPLQNWLISRAEKIVGTTLVYVMESPHLEGFRHKCTYVPIGINPIIPDYRGAAKIREKTGGKLLLSIGRLVPYKGYGYLIEAMKYLPEDYHLIIAGTGPMKKGLEQKIITSGLNGRVTLWGYVKDELIPALYTACDVFVLSSVMKTEAFGIVQIEAMSCGKPVVATMIPASGVSWVNDHGVSGVNVTPANSQALARGIETAYEIRESLGRGAESLFQQRYTIDKMIDNIIRVYENQS